MMAGKDEMPYFMDDTVRMLVRKVEYTRACRACILICKIKNLALIMAINKGMRGFNMPRLAHSWLHLYTLGPKPGTPLDVLEVSELFLSCPTKLP